LGCNADHGHPPLNSASLGINRLEGLPGLTAFADSLTSDLDAVTRGLTTRWNSGPIEGRVNHIKMLKRQMFGRASLRKRVLLTASR
jgi:transposase